MNTCIAFMRMYDLIILSMHVISELSVYYVDGFQICNKETVAKINFKLCLIKFHNRNHCISGNPTFILYEFLKHTYHCTCISIKTYHLWGNLSK